MQHVFMYFPYGCHQSHAISCFNTQDAGMDPTICRLTGKSPCPGGGKPHWGRQPVESQEKPAGIQHQNARRMFLFQKKMSKGLTLSKLRVKSNLQSFYNLNHAMSSMFSLFWNLLLGSLCSGLERRGRSTTCGDMADSYKGSAQIPEFHV